MSTERSWPWLMAGMRQYGKSGLAGCNPAVLPASGHRLAERRLALSPRPPSPQHNGAAFLA